MNVYQTIIAVKADLGAVSKDKKMEAGPAKYNYRGIDDVLNKLHAAQTKHGLVIAPQLRSVVQSSAGETRSGTKQTRTLCEFGYRIAGPDGDFFETATMGEAIDSGDKGTNKAGTSAFKQLLTQLFAIPFETNDPDTEHTEVVSPKAKPETPKAPAANTPAPKPAEKPEKLPPSADSNLICGTCGYAIGGSDRMKIKGGKKHHYECLSGPKSTAKVTEPAPVEDEGPSIEDRLSDIFDN